MPRRNAPAGGSFTGFRAVDAGAVVTDLKTPGVIAVRTLGAAGTHGNAVPARGFPASIAGVRAGVREIHTRAVVADDCHSTEIADGALRTAHVGDDPVQARLGP